MVVVVLPADNVVVVPALGPWGVGQPASIMIASKAARIKKPGRQDIRCVFIWDLLRRKEALA
jgi:hypothetical protein